MRFAALMLFSCASAEALKPNTSVLCDRAIECGLFSANELSACVECLEHWAAQINDAIEEALPPPHTIDCALLAFVADDKRISECVAERWWE